MHFTFDRCDKNFSMVPCHDYIQLGICPVLLLFPLLRKHGYIKSHSSVCPYVCPSDIAFILGMCVLCGKTFLMVPCHDLVSALWPTSRSNLLPIGGPQFSEYACFHSTETWNCLKFIQSTIFIHNWISPVYIEFSPMSEYKMGENKTRGKIFPVYSICY